MLGGGRTRSEESPLGFRERLRWLGDRHTVAA